MKSKKGIIVAISVVIVALIAIFVWVVKETNAESEKYIAIVRDGCFEEYPDVSVGKALDNYFTDGHWSYANIGEDSTEGIEHSVTFEGDCEIDDEKVHVNLWFVVENDDSFWFNSGFVNKAEELGLEAEDFLYMAMMSE